ncbi:hypothetical protein ACFWIW_03715 [Amycolatopsis sp. NPDC058340]
MNAFGGGETGRPGARIGGSVVDHLAERTQRSTATLEQKREIS